MKELYTAPEATIINLAAVEKLAALDGHPDEGLSTASEDDILGSIGFGTGSGRPT